MLKKLPIMILFALTVLLSIPAVSNATTFNNGVPKEIEANDIINYGNTLLGTPYLFGAKYGRTDVFDCSSFVKTVYRNYITLPRSSRQQAQVGQWVSRNNLVKGDLVFFRTYRSSSNKITHVAIYAGNGMLLHAYGAGGVKYSKFSGSWYDRFVTARRVLQ